MPRQQRPTRCLSWDSAQKPVGVSEVLLPLALPLPCPPLAVQGRKEGEECRQGVKRVLYALAWTCTCLACQPTCPRCTAWGPEHQHSIKQGWCCWQRAHWTVGHTRDRSTGHTAPTNRKR